MRLVFNLHYSVNTVFHSTFLSLFPLVAKYHAIYLLLISPKLLTLVSFLKAIMTSDRYCKNAQHAFMKIAEVYC